MSVTKTLDIMAQEWFGEFGFATCSHEERDILVNALYKEQQDQKYDVKNT